MSKEYLTKLTLEEQIEAAKAFLTEELRVAKERLKIHNQVRIQIEEWDGKVCTSRFAKALEGEYKEEYHVYYVNEKTSKFIELKVRGRGSNPRVDEWFHIVDKDDNKENKISFARFEAQNHTHYVVARMCNIESFLREPLKIEAYIRAVNNLMKCVYDYTETIESMDKDTVMRGALPRVEGDILHKIRMAL